MVGFSPVKAQLEALYPAATSIGGLSFVRESLIVRWLSSTAVR